MVKFVKFYTCILDCITNFVAI